MAFMKLIKGVGGYLASTIDGDINKVRRARARATNSLSLASVPTRARASPAPPSAVHPYGRA